MAQHAIGGVARHEQRATAGRVTARAFQRGRNGITHDHEFDRRAGFGFGGPGRYDGAGDRK